MSRWSPREAIIMERRHILEGEQRVCRQEALLAEVIAKGYDQNIHTLSTEILGLLREGLELSRQRLRDLENRYGKEGERR
jgi:hypothetical protein